ncbi:MAG: hypothetical protein WD045_12465, partial [Pirellulaceae bacterium]
LAIRVIRVIRGKKSPSSWHCPGEQELNTPASDEISHLLLETLTQSTTPPDKLLDLPPISATIKFETAADSRFR